MENAAVFCDVFAGPLQRRGGEAARKDPCGAIREILPTTRAPMLILCLILLAWGPLSRRCYCCSCDLNRAFPLASRLEPSAPGLDCLLVGWGYSQGFRVTLSSNRKSISVDFGLLLAVKLMAFHVAMVI